MRQRVAAIKRAYISYALLIHNLVASITAVILIHPIIHPLVASIVLIISHEIPRVPAIAIPRVVLIGSLIVPCPAPVENNIPGITAEVLIIPSIVALVSAIVLIMPAKLQVDVAIGIAMKVLIMRLPAFRMEMELSRTAADSEFCLRSCNLSGRSECG